MKTFNTMPMCLTYFFLYRCNGQKLEKEVAEKNEKFPAPQDSIKVNKKHDGSSNLLDFDSIDFYSFKNVKVGTLAIDSLQKSFDSFFNENYSPVFRPHFEQLFWTDS
jgi:hypothetical protein